MTNPTSVSRLLTTIDPKEYVTSNYKGEFSGSTRTSKRDRTPDKGMNSSQLEMFFKRSTAVVEKSAL